MFWTNLGKSAAIERSGMDGSMRDVIVGHNTTWPNGLALDHTDDRIYWVDAGTHALESCRLDGSNRKVSTLACWTYIYIFSIWICRQWISYNLI